MRARVVEYVKDATLADFSCYCQSWQYPSRSGFGTIRRAAMGITAHDCLSRADDELLEPQLIDVAPTPFFTGFDGTGDGMLGRSEVLDGLLVLGRIAATDVTALHAHPELQPRVEQHDTIVTNR